MLESLRRLVLTPTPPIVPANYRTFVSLNLGTMTASVVHLCVLPLFWWLGAFELIWLNIFSQIAYVSALSVNRLGRHYTTIAIALVELSVHQAFCVKYIGWGTGFQYYLLVLPAMVFFLPAGRLASQLVLLVLSTAAFVSLLAWSRDLVPVHDVAPNVQAIIAYANIAVVFGLLGFFGFNYRRAAEVAEERLAATERKQAEDRLILLKAAVSAAHDIIIITDETGNIEFVNDAFTRIAGYSPAEAIGNNVRMLKSGKHSTSFYSEMWRTITSGNSWTGRMVNRRKSGELYTESSTITPIKGEDGTIQHYLAIKQDVTEAERAQERLARTEEQLRQAQKLEAIGTLAGGIAHDFNNLLTSILGSADFLRDGLPEGDSKLEDVDEIKKAGERAALLTRQLLAFSRKQVLSPKVLDLNQVIGGVERLLRRATSEQVEILFKLAPSADPVEADEAQIGQVLLNLVVNANDSMPQGGMLLIETENAHFPVAVGFHEFTIPAGRYVVISVSDTGQGIEADLLHEVFEPFFTTKEVGKGTGLGLSTVYGIVKQSGGHVAVHSELDVGTTFRVYLPSTTQPRASIPSLSSLDLERGTETLLLVEDEPSVRSVILRMLRNCGYDVLEASNGQEALEVLDEHSGPVHLLFTDVMMPGIDGATLAARVTSTYPNTKVIFASGYPGEIIAKHGDFITGRNFLSKPFAPNELATLIRRVLDA